MGKDQFNPPPCYYGQPGVKHNTYFCRLDGEPVLHRQCHAKDEASLQRCAALFAQATFNVVIAERPYIGPQHPGDVGTDVAKIAEKNRFPDNNLND